MRLHTRTPKNFVVKTGAKKPPASGITKGKEPQKTEFQKLLEKWPPKVK
jgi:hypothetical protein